MNDMSTEPKNGLTSPQSELFSPSLYETLFWRPRFLVNSPVLLYAPFLFWLTAMVQPRRIVVVGADDGQAHFVFCQAIDKLNLRASCLGLGIWSDADGSVPAALHDHNLRFYEDMGNLVACPSCESAVSQIAPRAGDLLFIDLDALGADMAPDLDDCLSAMGDSGILVVHGLNGLIGPEPSDLTPAADALRKRIGHLEQIRFPAGAGLGLYILGEGAPPRLRGLLEADEHGLVPREIGAVFRTLGEGLGALERAQRLERDAEALRGSLAGSEKAREDNAAELAEYRRSHDLTLRKLAQARAQMFDQQSALHDRSERIALLEAELVARDATLEQARHGGEAALRAAQEAHSAELVTRQAALEQSWQKNEVVLRSAHQAELTACVATMEQTRHEAEAALRTAQNTFKIERDTRFKETAALTRMIEQARHETDAALRAALIEHTGKLKANERAQNEMAQELVKLSERLRASEQAILALSNENMALAAQNAELLNSTSWRITAPMRKIKQSLSRD